MAAVSMTREAMVGTRTTARGTDMGVGHMEAALMEVVMAAVMAVHMEEDMGDMEAAVMEAVMGAMAAPTVIETLVMEGETMEAVMGVAMEVVMEVVLVMDVMTHMMPTNLDIQMYWQMDILFSTTFNILWIRSRDSHVCWMPIMMLCTDHLLL